MGERHTHHGLGDDLPGVSEQTHEHECDPNHWLFPPHREGSAGNARLDVDEVARYDARAAKVIAALPEVDAVAFGRLARQLADYLELPAHHAAVYAARGLKAYREGEPTSHHEGRDEDVRELARRMVKSGYVDDEAEALAGIRSAMHAEPLRSRPAATLTLEPEVAASLASIAADAHTVVASLPSVLRTIGDALSVISGVVSAEAPDIGAALRCLPEIAMLLQQLNAPHEEVSERDLGIVLYGAYKTGRIVQPDAGAGARLMDDFRANGWRLIRARPAERAPDEWPCTTCGQPRDTPGCVPGPDGALTHTYGGGTTSAT